MHTQRDVVRHYEQNEAAALDLLRRWRELEDEVDDLREAAIAQRDAAVAELARVYLPTLDAPAVARAERLTGYRGFSRRDPLEAMKKERAMLERTIARIEADETYVRRKLLVGPGGERTLALEEAKDMLAPWEAECAPYEACEGWEELLATGYDTPAYEVSFFEKRYWTLWRLGDRACEALGVGDFGDEVLPAFRKADRQRQVWRRQVREAEDDVHEVHELVRTRDLAEARLPRLPQEFLAASQEQLAGYLADADLPLLEQWLVDDASPDAPDRALLVALRRAAGLGAKVRLLGELLHEGVAPQIGQLHTRKAKFTRKAAKFARSKHYGQRFIDRDLDLGFQQKLEKYRSRVDKLRRLAQRIAGYEDYARFDLATNAEELWFSAMTGKQPPSQFPSTRRWYDRHPDVVPVFVAVESMPDALLEAASAVEVVADYMGYLS